METNSLGNHASAIRRAHVRALGDRVLPLTSSAIINWSINGPVTSLNDHATYKKLQVLYMFLTYWWLWHNLITEIGIDNCEIQTLESKRATPDVCATALVCCI